jgi:DNA-binding MarR family transcriptional regulator
MATARTSSRAHSNGDLTATNAGAVHAALRKVVRRFLSIDDSMMDLPLRQLKVCVSLYGQSRSMSEIGRELSLSPSAVTQISDRLERRDLIERVFQDEDRRVRKLRLTRKGQQLIRRREQQQLVRIEAALHGLTEDDVGRVLAGLDILTKVSTTPETATT